MIKTIIVDDEYNAREFLEKLLNRYFINKFIVLDKCESVDQAVSDSSPETVWFGSSAYVFPPDVGTGIQIHSTNNADTEQVVIEGLDENFLMKSWTGNLNGTGYVNANGKWTRIFGAYNNSSTSFSGTVNIHPSGDVSSNYLLINAYNNQSLMAVYTIPANYTGYLVAYGMSAHNAGSSSSIFYNINLFHKLSLVP
mgnify:CR=1 FL=1